MAHVTMDIIFAHFYLFLLYFLVWTLRFTWFYYWVPLTGERREERESGLQSSQRDSVHTDLHRLRRPAQTRALLNQWEMFFQWKTDWCCCPHCWDNPSAWSSTLCPQRKWRHVRETLRWYNKLTHLLLILVEPSVRCNKKQNSACE